MAARWLRAALPFLLLLPSTTLALQNDFSFYPKNSQSCLDDSAEEAGCNGSNVEDLNHCLCGNSNDFIINAAKCIGENDPEDGDDVYDTMSTACGDSQTPITVRKSEFQAAVKEGESPTTTTTTTTAATTTAATTSGTAAATTTTSAVTAQPTETSDSDDDKIGRAHV